MERKMTVETQERVLSLRDVVQYELPPLFRRHHLGRDFIIGLIGDRGDGKSIGGAVITLLDYMIESDICWSNMKITASFDIDAETAGDYGFNSGDRVQFASEELDKHKLLTFDPEYSDGVFFTDEINIYLADARRSMSHQNLGAADFGQELRKLRSAWVYTSIHEMFVESRIRDITDVFILTKDTALSPKGLAQKRPPGIDFEWTIYPMTRKLTGERYADTRKPLPPIYLHGKKFWGSIDTYERQERKKWVIPTENIELEESLVVVEARSKWGWLYEKILALHNQGISSIQDDVLWKYLQVKERGISTNAVGRQLKAMGITSGQGYRGHFDYNIDAFDLKTDLSLGKKDYILKDANNQQVKIT